MLVPRSFKYTSTPVANARNDKARSRSSRRSTPPADRTPQLPPTTRAVTEPVTIPSSKPTNAPTSNADHLEPRTMPYYYHRSATFSGTRSTRRKDSCHDPTALPPAVAALLAVTAIPPRRPNRYRTRPGSDRRISIEELVKDWESDASLRPSYGGGPALDILLETIDVCEDAGLCSLPGELEPSYLNRRTASSESMPSLESDDRSVFSGGSPSTPSSLRSSRSYQNLKKDRSRSLPAAEECAHDHPLVSLPESGDADFSLSVDKKAIPATKPRSSFKSNLTTSLQSIKNAAVNSISSLGRTSTVPVLYRNTAPAADGLLWSHPFLFPRFAPEFRPSLMDGMPSQAERRYLNPVPLTFEEQEAPFQQALHAPFLAEMVEDAPTIQMQTYNRGRRRAGPKRGAGPSSEAGRALLGTAGVRQREVRENSDFLRVVVLEMNMRREGKLEQGRARIWLPPREVSPAPTPSDRVSTRWVGESAY